MQYRILGNKVVVELDKEDVAKTSAGIYLSSEVEKIKDKNIGTIVHVGLECERKIETISGQIRKFKVGDRVAIFPHQGTIFDIGGEVKIVLFSEDHIVGMIYE